MNINIGKDEVHISFKETVRNIPHKLTNKEQQSLSRNNRSSSRYMEPWQIGIRKYDHEYTGNLCMRIGFNKKIYDSQKTKLEERLGEMLIRIYEEAEKRRKEREPWEAIRIEMEAEQRQRMKVVEAIQYEIDKTRELLNKSEDYKIASQIRAYVSALEKSEDAEQNSERIEWAKNKADWYDPVVSKEDPIFA